MKYTHFHEARFQKQVENALISVKRILDTTRNPRLAHEEDNDHHYEDKFALASLLTNTALVAHMTVLERLGLTSDQLEAVAKWVHEEKETVTMRFSAIQACSFLQEKEVPFVQGSTTVVTKETERSGRLFGKSSEKKEVKHKVTTMIKEYHWKVRVQYQLQVFAGVTNEGDNNPKVLTLQSRDSSTTLIIKGTEKVPFLNVTKHDPMDVDITWFLQQMDPTKKICRFTIDRSNADECRTPRRNIQVDQAVAAVRDLCGFADRLRHFLRVKIEKDILGRHVPTVPMEKEKKKSLSTITADSLYNPILPLMEKRTIAAGATTGKDEGELPNALVALSAVDDEESPLLSMADMDKFLGEQIRTLEEATKSIQQQFPTDALVSTAEAKLVLLCCHMEQLGRQYEDCVDYLEDMLKKQLVAAIGKEVQANDFEEFMSFYYQTKVYGEAYAPNPFCFAIRRPGYYPDGILSIEQMQMQSTGSSNMEPVETFTRKILTTESTPPMRAKLNAATTVQLTGDRYLHGWMQYRFSSGGIPKQYRLAARARQFSCFLVMVGTMAGPDRFEPKDAIVLQNKDELMIPLLLNALPTAKEFKDAISSLSPEQQQFAKGFREMQLESSVFGVCVVQLKPQLEDLLGLPSGGLTKEMQLTQDLLTLFIDYQIPSDLLSYDGPADDERAKKITLVKEYTKSVLDVIQGEKDKQLKEAKEQADMAIEASIVDSSEGSSSEDEMPVVHAEDYSEIAGASRFKKKKMRMVKMSGAIPKAAMRSAQMMVDSLGGPSLSIERRAGDQKKARSSVPERPEWSYKLPLASGAALKTPTESSPLRQEQAIDDENPQAVDGVVDFTRIPKQLDKQFEVHDSDNALRATIIKSAGAGWTRMRQPNLLTKPAQSVIDGRQIRTEKNKAFDLLDALSRSGSLALRYSELHVVVAVTHCFENDVMGTVIQDNINPIEKVERSSLLMASTIYGQAPRTLLQNGGHAERLKGSFPALFDGDT